MIFKISTYWFVLAVLFLLQPSLLRSQDDTLRVLFVGNSYTYFWNLPQLVSAMAANQGKAIITRQSTAGGVSWKQHWEGEKGLNSREMITKGSWDYVILQNHSLSAISDPEEFQEYGQKFARLAQENGAKPVFYITWARKANPLMQKAITEQYVRLAEQTNAELVPVGPLWMRSGELRPDLNLYDPDGSHPSPQGVYLTACLFYQFLTGQSVLEIPPRITTTDKNGEKMYLSIMDSGDAEFVRQLVEEFDMTLETAR